VLVTNILFLVWCLYIQDGSAVYRGQVKWGLSECTWNVYFVYMEVVLVLEYVWKEKESALKKEAPTMRPGDYVDVFLRIVLTHRTFVRFMLCAFSHVTCSHISSDLCAFK
jgi:hypothetical protein